MFREGACRGGRGEPVGDRSGGDLARSVSGGDDWYGAKFTAIVARTVVCRRDSRLSCYACVYMYSAAWTRERLPFGVSRALGPIRGSIAALCRLHLARSRRPLVFRHGL